jgi:hypothetical protein
MRRPWLANSLTILSLVLALLLIAIWVRGYRVGHEFDYMRPTWFAGASTERGHVAVFWGEGIRNPGLHHLRRKPLDQPQWVRDNVPGAFVRLGFAYGRQASGYGIIVIPLWLPALILTTISMLGLRAWRRRRRLHRTPFACRHCGYDLRATPERCPECGTVATPT